MINIIRNLTTEELYEFSNSSASFPIKEFSSFMNVFNEIRNYHSDFPLEVSVRQNMNFLAHWHNEIEIVRVLEGSVILGANSEKRKLVKGDIALFTSGDIHYYESSDASSTLLFIVFQPDLVQSIADHLQNSNISYSIFDQDAFREVKPEVAESIYSSIDLIQQEYNKKTPYFDVIIRGQLILLFGLLLRHFHTCFHDRYYLKASGDKSIRLIQDAIRYINLNYAGNITLKSLSDYLGISTFYFSRLFSTLTGTTFKAYLNGIRINKACNMLAKTDQRIIDVAYECGFNSLRTFNRIYREIKGNSPSASR